MSRLKSRYCVKCEALYQWQCSCPNNKKHKNIMKTFHKISMARVTEASMACGLNQNKENFKKG